MHHWSLRVHPWKVTDTQKERGSSSNHPSWGAMFTWICLASMLGKGSKAIIPNGALMVIHHDIIYIYKYHLKQIQVKLPARFTPENAVDGRNPAPVDNYFILPVIIHPRWCRISSINSRPFNHKQELQNFQHSSHQNKKRTYLTLNPGCLMVYYIINYITGWDFIPLYIPSTITCLLTSSQAVNPLIHT